MRLYFSAAALAIDFDVKHRARARSVRAHHRQRQRGADALSRLVGLATRIEPLATELHTSVATAATRRPAPRPRRPPP